jgi:hypothetical protein
MQKAFAISACKKTKRTQLASMKKPNRKRLARAHRLLRMRKNHASYARFHIGVRGAHVQYTTNACIESRNWVQYYTLVKYTTMHAAHAKKPSVRKWRAAKRR